MNDLKSFCDYIKAYVLWVRYYSSLSLICCHTAILVQYFVLNVISQSCQTNYLPMKTPLSSRESEQRASWDVGSRGTRGDGLEQPQWAGGLLAGGEGHTTGKIGGSWKETGKSESRWQLEGSPPPGKRLICVHQRTVQFSQNISFSQGRNHTSPLCNVLTAQIVYTVV